MRTSPLKFKALLSILIAAVGIFAIMVLVGKVLTPFIIALILAYILNPLVLKLEKKFNIKRKYSALAFSILILLIFIAIPVFLIPMIASELLEVVDNTPQIITIINSHALVTINQHLGTHLNIDYNSFKTMLAAQQSRIVNNLDLVQNIAQNGMILIEIVVFIVLIPFALFYSILNWSNVINSASDLIPRSFVKSVTSLFHDVDVMLSSYLRGQLSVMIVMAAYYGIGLTIAKLPSGAAIGIITGLLVFIPYLGVLSGFLISMVISIAQLQDASMIGVFIVFAVGHMLEGGLVTPFLVGGKIGLNPIMIILSLMVLGKLFGIVGVLLALPLSTIAVVLVKHIYTYYKSTNYYKN